MNRISLTSRHNIQTYLLLPGARLSPLYIQVRVSPRNVIIHLLISGRDSIYIINYVQINNHSSFVHSDWSAIMYVSRTRQEH